MVHDRLEVLNAIAEDQIMHLFAHHDPDVVIEIIDAIAAGGGRVVEFTNRVQFAPAVFEAIRRHVDANHPEMVIGVGSVEDSATAALFVSLGAEFIVSPIFVSETAEFCNRRKVPYLPGTMTITEIAEAERYGVEFVKLYPAMDPMFVQAVKMPRPWSRIIANGPIGPDAVRSWLDAGATAIGTMASVPPQAVAAGNFAEVSSAVSALIAAREG